MCIFHSPDPQKNPEPLRYALEQLKPGSAIDATGWVFNFEVDLRGVSPELAIFSRCTFLDDVSFYRATFNTVAFDYAEFRGHAQFGRVVFTDRAFFPHVTFRKSASFRETEFRDEAAFWKAAFDQNAWFVSTRFEREVDFREAVFKGDARFKFAVFRSRITFENVQFGFMSKFEDTSLEGLRFRGCSMEYVSLARAYGLSDAEFDHVTWGTLRLLPRWSRLLPPPVRDYIWRGTSGVVWEERFGRMSGDVELLRDAETTYRELRRGLERRRHYQEARTFRVRELEMRRLRTQAPGLGALFSIFGYENLYRLLSNYGYSVIRPLMLLFALILFVIPFLFAAAQVRVGTMEYGLAWPGTPGARLVDGDLVVLALRNAALMPEPQGVALGHGGQVVAVTARIAGPLLAFLVTLGVRNHFRS